MTIAKAEKFAAENNAEDADGWTYKVQILNPERDYAKVEIFEADGYKVGEMS
jgi:hypothetical protein